MCGIIGFVTRTPVHSAADIVDALRRLEYRGYDSSGIALIDGDGERTVCKAVGKIRALDGAIAELSSGLQPVAGLAHTRWATHGVPNHRNAHPHVSGRTTIVHNGIVNNDAALRGELAGHVSLQSETDSEVLAALLDGAHAEHATPMQALQAVLPRIEGLFAFVAHVSGGATGLLFARDGSPLALGRGENGYYLGSDAIALAPFCQSVIYLEDGDYGELNADGFCIMAREGQDVSKVRPEVALNPAQWFVDKGNHSHFMHKEIHEQPTIIGNQVAHMLPSHAQSMAEALAQHGLDPEFLGLLARSPVVMTACGSAYYACMVARHWMERLGIGGEYGVDIEMASEFRQRRRRFPRGTLAIVVSQSGETMDTLTAMKHLQASGVRVAVVVNNTSSTMARLADFVIPILAGPEIGVASTKAFTAQLTTLAVLTALAAEQANGGEEGKGESALGIWRKAGVLANAVLQQDDQLAHLARRIFGEAPAAMFLGRGVMWPIALEGALKLKETSYIHAEGMAAGEMKHGPIALVDRHLPVVVLAPSGGGFDKTLANIKEIAARGGQLLVITDRLGDENLAAAGVVADTVVVPIATSEAAASKAIDAENFWLAPILHTLVLQCLAYHAAVARGTDVDQPRNLAKSVTVE